MQLHVIIAVGDDFVLSMTPPVRLGDSLPTDVEFHSSRIRLGRLDRRPIARAIAVELHAGFLEQDPRPRFSGELMSCDGIEDFARRHLEGPHEFTGFAARPHTTSV